MLSTRLVSVSVQLALLLAIVVIPAQAAPAAAVPGTAACSASQAPHALGVDGGLTGLSRGEFSLQPASASASRPLGVDGGLLSLLFVRSEQARPVAHASTCAGAFIPTGG